MQQIFHHVSWFRKIYWLILHINSWFSSVIIHITINRVFWFKIITCDDLMRSFWGFCLFKLLMSANWPWLIRPKVGASLCPRRLSPLIFLCHKQLLMIYSWFLCLYLILINDILRNSGFNWLRQWSPLWLDKIFKTFSKLFILFCDTQILNFFFNIRVFAVSRSLAFFSYQLSWGIRTIICQSLGNATIF